MASRRVLIYGAAGHTGEMIARRAQDRGLDVILAGRPSSRLEDLARSLRCDWRAAEVRDDTLAGLLRDVAVVVNAAGPFEETASPMAKACIASNCHYLDINGEVVAYKYVAAYDPKAAHAGVMVMPGVGFCVIASTFLMRMLVSPASNPPINRPTKVRIAFSGGPASSVGSIKSLYTSLYPGVTVVRDRDTTPVPIGSLERAFEFGEAGGRLDCTAISVADTLAALHDAPASVRQIESYVEGSLFTRTFFESSGRFTRFSKVQPWKSFVEKSMQRWPATPDTGVDTRAAVVVEVEDPWATTRSAVHEASSTYDFTAIAACEIARLIVAGVGVKPGFQTPASQYFGHPDLHTALGLSHSPSGSPVDKSRQRATAG